MRTMIKRGKMHIAFTKPDMDTCLAAMIAVGSKIYTPIHVQEGARQGLLDDKDVVCIECGGSGQTEFSNFDHHVVGWALPSACFQAYAYYGCDSQALMRLVSYVHKIDMGEYVDSPPEFPSLSNVFSGMLLSGFSAKETLKSGMDIFRTVLEYGIDPYDRMPKLSEWNDYISICKKNKKAIEVAVQNIIEVVSPSGLKVGYLCSNLYGGMGHIYKKGCPIAVLYNPDISKITVGTTGVSLANALRELDRYEFGWGGRNTIISSPARGTSLTPGFVINTLFKCVRGNF